MRQLRVVGLGDDQETVIFEDPIRHERFAVPGDERLRAAARGDVRRLGQMEIEVTSPLRPRDIQARIRAGETVEAVAAGGGVGRAHVERFAHPVLLERARVAELARRAHPQRDDHADPRTLGEILLSVFVARGQDYDEARWDACKGEDAQWVVTLSWQAGRSDNTARWTYRPGPAGGVVVPRDDPARDLVGETPVGPRRSDGTPAGETAETHTPEDRPVVEATQEELPAALAASGDSVPAVPAVRTSPARPARPEGRRVPVPTSPRAGRGRRPLGGADQMPDQVPDQRAAEARPDSAGPTAAEEPADTEGIEGTDGGKGRGRRQHPIVPSWEDVLLGVRSPRS